MGNQNSLSSIYLSYGAISKGSNAAARKKAHEDEMTMRNELIRVFGSTNRNVTGGAEGGSVLGGYEDLQDYGNSLYSRAKETLIRNIAKEVFKALGATGLKNADSMPIGEVVKRLAKVIPPMPRNPKKFAEGFNNHSKAQKSVCRALASAINKHYGGMIIDLDLDDNEICNKVAEVMHSLFTGLHTEFMNVAGDVLRVMKNMQVVMDYIERAYKKQKELAERSGNSATKDAAQSTDEVYKTIKAEYDRQTAILANLMNVTVGPTGKSLISSLEDNGDFAGLVKDLKAQVGTKAFGDKLAHLLAGVSSVAHAAELIEKALKKIGMTVQEFKNAKNNYDLHMKVYNHVLKSSPSSKRLDEMMAAAKIIYDNTYDHDSIAKYLAKKGKGETLGGEESDSDDEKNGGLVMGGDDDDDSEDLPAYWAKKSMSKKISNKKKYREMILSDFRKVLKLHYRNIVEAADKISKHIGRDIPISDDLDQFVKTFSDLPNLDKEKLHIALSGYAKDPLSKEKREQFMNKYDSTIRSAEPLTKGPQGQLFNQVKQAMQGMIKSIDDFSDKMVRALTEIHVDNPDAIASALRSTASSFYGAAESDDVFGTGSWVAFDKVKAEMKYFFSIANIKTNIGRANADMKSYADDYEQVLGEEAGYIINNIKKQYNDLLNLDYKNTTEPTGVSQNVLNVYRALHGMYNTPLNTVVDYKGDATQNGKTRAEWLFKNLCDLWTYQMNAKINMINVAQAVDLYLKAFTDGVSKNPDSVSHITKILDQVEIVARWFNEKSGDNLASLFEVFPNSVDPTNSQAAFSTGDHKSHIDADGKELSFLSSNTHYYNWLEGRWTAGATAGPDAAGVYTVQADHYNLPGNPFLGRQLTPEITTNHQLKSTLKLSEKVVKSMRALENILSCFASIGTKFGELDPMSKTFMNAGQIFNALCQYISASAFTHQFLPSTNDGINDYTEAAYHGKVTELGIQTDDTAPANNIQNIPTNNRREHYRLAVNGNIHWSENHAIINNGIIAANDNRNRTTTEGSSQYGIMTGVGGITEDSFIRKYTALAMSAIPAETQHINPWKYHDLNDTDNKPRVDLAGWQDNFYDTDLLFEMSIKAIVAKVFTIVDAYRLFHRPTTDRRASYSLNPLRVILGGNEGGAEGGALLQNVKIIKEAVEFYFRLILLAEWYREQYGFVNNRTQNGEAWVLSIVPSVDGVWSDFIDIIFSKAEYVKEGNYSETQVQKLILAMNDIWKSYKARYPKSTVRNIINAFVLEMNRIFGFIKQKEIDSYIKDRRSFLDDSEYNDYKDEENFIDYDILNANDQFGSRPAPSDKFVDVNVKRSQARKQRNMIFLQEEIEKIRKNMDVQFINATRNAEDTTFSFQNTLKIYKNEVENAKSDNDAYNVVLRMIQGANKYINLNSDKLIMVHEMIAAPLVCVYGVYKVLARYNAFLHGCSLKNLEKWSQKRTVNGHAANINIDNAMDARNSYRASIAEDYKNSTDLMKDLFTRSFLGNINGNFGAFAAGAAGLGVIQNAGYLLSVGRIPQGTGIAADSIYNVGIMTDLLNSVVDLCSNQNKLVTCSVAANNINIDWSALEELCVTTLAQVKENVKKLRNMFDPNLAADIVDKFEDRKLVGSTRWLEEHLVEILFKDRDECGLPRAHTEHFRYTFDKLSKPGPGGATAANNVQIHLTTNNPPPYYGTMMNALRQLIYYKHDDTKTPFNCTSRSCDFKEFPFNVIAPVRVASSAETKDLVSGKASAINTLMPVPTILFDLPMRRPDVHSLYISRLGKSLFMTFNRVLYNYLYTCFDDNNQKFYPPLIEGFVNSSASYEILQGKAYPNSTLLLHDLNTELVNDFCYNPNNNDNAANIAANTCFASPTPTSVVWLSNAATIRSILTTTTTIGTTQKKKHLFDNLAEVPEFTKERLKVNLPLYSRLLSDFYDRTILLKSIINNTNIKDNIAAGTLQNENNFERMITVGVDPLLKLDGKDAGYIREYLTTMLNKMSDLSSSLKKCADSVYRELQDRPPHFFETSKDFLSDYRNRFGGLPLMPVSSILAPLRCYEGELERQTTGAFGPVAVIPEAVTAADAAAAAAPGGAVGAVINQYMLDHGINAGGRRYNIDRVDVETDFHPANISYVMLPVKENGSAVYKFNYATRLLLANNTEPNMEHFPGAKELYNSYASGVSKSTLLSPQEFADTVKKTVKLGKFLADGAVYSRLYNEMTFTSLTVPKYTVYKDELDPARAAGATDKLLAGMGVPTSRHIHLHSRSVFESLRWRDTKHATADISEVMIALKDLFNLMLVATVYQANGIARTHHDPAAIAPTLAAGGHATVAAAAAAGDVNVADYLHVITTSTSGIGNPAPNNWTDAAITTTATAIYNERPGAALGAFGPNAIALMVLLYPYFIEVINLGLMKNVPGNVPTVEHIKKLIEEGIEYIYTEDPHNMLKNQSTKQGYHKERQLRNMSILPLSDPMGINGILELTENSDIKVSKERLATSLGITISDIKDKKRDDLRVFNILDMNIVPINVHAFMREVPFVNLLNYSYTFDRMIHDFIIPSYISKKVDGSAAGSQLTTDNIIISANDMVASTRELLIKLLVHPYAKLNPGIEYYALTASLFNGNDNLKLGRPRYLSDQLWHKVLMTSSAQLVAGQERYDMPGNTPANRYGTTLNALEAGPQAYEAVRAVQRYGDPFMNQNRDISSVVTNTNEWIELFPTLLATLNGVRAFGAGRLNPITDMLRYISSMPKNDALSVAQLPINGAPNTPTGNRGPGYGLGPTRITGIDLSWGANTLGGDDAYMTLAVINNLINVVAPTLRPKTRNTLVGFCKKFINNNGPYENFIAHYGLISDLIFNRINQAPLQQMIAAHAAAAGGPAAGYGGTIRLLHAAVDANCFIMNNAAVAFANNLKDNIKRLITNIVRPVAIANNNKASVLRMKRETVEWYQNERKIFGALPGAGTDEARLAGHENTRAGLIELLENVGITGRQQFEDDTKHTLFDKLAPGLNPDHISRDGTYHILSLLSDVLPIPCVAARLCLKNIAANALAGATVQQIVTVLREITGTQAFGLKYNLLDKVAVECMIVACDNSAQPDQCYGDSLPVVMPICKSMLGAILIELDSMTERDHNKTEPLRPSYLVLPSNPVATPGLKILKPNEWKENTWTVVNTTAGNQNNMAMGDVLYCAELGKMRFDTKLVRNLSWLVNLQRIMRVIMVNHLSHLNTPVIRGLKIANPKVTEYESNEKFEESDYYGDNYEAL